MSGTILQIGVGLAGAGVRHAASIASVPFRVPFQAAQRRYFAVGRQLFLCPDHVSTVLPGELFAAICSKIYASSSLID